MDENNMSNSIMADSENSEVESHEDSLRQEYDSLYGGMAPVDILYEIENANLSEEKRKGFKGILFDDAMFELFFGYLRYGKKGKVFADAETRDFVLNLGAEVAPRYTKLLTAADARNLNQTVSCAVEVLYGGDYADKHLSEIDFYKSIVEIIKDSLPGFYRGLGENIIGKPMDPVVAKLCDILDDYFSTTKADAQVGLLEPALEEYPDSLVINSFLGDAYYYDKKWEKAISCLLAGSADRTLPILHPIDLEFNLGYSYSKLKKVQESIEHYKKCLDLYPDHANAYNNLGYQQHLAKDFEGAYESFKRCLELSPNDTYAANNIVRTMIKLGRLDELKAYVDNPPRKLRKDIIAEAEKALSGAGGDIITSEDTSVPPVETEEKPSSSSQTFSTSGWTVE